MKKFVSALLIAIFAFSSSTSVFAQQLVEGWGESETGAIVYGEWNVSEDGTVTSTTGGGWNQIYNGDHSATDYTVQADVKWLETGTTADYPKFGLITAYQDVNNLTAAFLDKQYNVLAVFAKQQGEEDVWENADLPEDFDWSVAHELKVVKSGNDFEYYVDGELMMSKTFAIDNGEVGLITEDIKAEFSNINVSYPLPETATNSYNLLLAGALLVLIGGGVFFFNRRRVNA